MSPYRWKAEQSGGKCVFPSLRELHLCRRRSARAGTAPRLQGPGPRTGPAGKDCLGSRSQCTEGGARAASLTWNPNQETPRGGRCRPAAPSHAPPPSRMVLSGTGRAGSSVPVPARVTPPSHRPTVHRSVAPGARVSRASVNSCSPAEAPGASSTAGLDLAGEILDSS